MSIRRARYSQFSWPLAAVLVLIAFWLGMLASLRGTSQTFDEGVHAVGGYTFWRFNDYRFNPENGNLPQRVMALPLLFGNYKFPPTDGDIWRASREWDLAWQWFYELGNDADAMTLRGRAASGLLAVALGVLVWRWSRQLFGQIGGMLSLLLYALNPSTLANGALMTSDTAAALFFFAATWSWWRMLRRLTFGRVAVSGLAMGGLFVSKMSAPLILLIALALVIARLFDPAPLPLHVFGFRELRSRATQLLGLAVSAVAVAVIVLMVIWSFYGFRYSAFSPTMPAGSWTGETWATLLDKPSPSALIERLEPTPAQREHIKQIFTREGAEPVAWLVASIKAVDNIKGEVLTTEQAAHLEKFLAEPSPRVVGRVLETLRHYRLLPEAYIYGFAHVWHGSLERAAFFNGEFSLYGWRTFFPYTFLVKTPLTLFLVIVIAIAAAIVRWRRQGPTAEKRAFDSGLYQTLPLWVLLGFYWAAAISSHLNIGHRHILPTYPPLFVLCGAAAWWFSPSPNGHNKPIAHSSALTRAARGALCIAVGLLAVEVFYRFPHYLAYFNGVVRPASAYRHLVYSSLDWGQDLPQVRRYIETRQPPLPVYLSYFGFASPAYYRVPAIYAYSVVGRYRSPPLKRLEFPAEQSDALLYDFLRRNSEYDDQVMGKARQNDKVFVVVVKKAAALRLTGGTYFISATLLQPIMRPTSGAFGPWNERLEKEYQIVLRVVAPLLSDDPAERSAALPQLPPDKWIEAIDRYEYLRFHRLAAFLRKREPDDNVGGSILIYHVSDNDLSRALDGPPVELGRDVLKELFGTSP